MRQTVVKRCFFWLVASSLAMNHASFSPWNEAYPILVRIHLLHRFILFTFSID